VTDSTLKAPVWACERCLTEPATVNDTHRGKLLCAVCCCTDCANPAADVEGCAYCAQWVGSIPYDLPAWPDRPTVPSNRRVTR
jgi:hypothetical protein